MTKPDRSLKGIATEEKQQPKTHFFSSLLDFHNNQKVTDLVRWVRTREASVSPFSFIAQFGTGPNPHQSTSNRNCDKEKAS